MVKSMIITVVTLLAAWPAIAQQERKFIREGNELFEKQDFEKAEVEYRKAADKKANSFEAAFNMADALYKQKKYDELWNSFLLWQNKKPIKNGWAKFIIISGILC